MSSLCPFIPRICRLTLTYPRYRMTKPPVPSNSNNLPKGWNFRVIYSQNPELMLETCAPKSINAVTLCPSTITEALLDHPTRQARGSGWLPLDLYIELPSCWLAFVWRQNGNARGLLFARAAVVSGGELHTLSSPWAGL